MRYMHELTLTNEETRIIEVCAYIFDNERDLKEHKEMLDQLEAEYLGLD